MAGACDGGDSGAGEAGGPLEPTAVCARCGRDSPSEPPPLGWSGGTERGRPHWVCDTCARANLRSIEGKLDEAWW